MSADKLQDEACSGDDAVGTGAVETGLDECSQDGTVAVGKLIAAFAEVSQARAAHWHDTELHGAPGLYDSHLDEVTRELENIRRHLEIEGTLD